MSRVKRRRRAPFDGHDLGPTPFESETRLPLGTSAVFLSDLHFGDGSATDLFAGKDRALIELLEDKRTEVNAIVFLGDIFDMPQAWSIPRITAAHGLLLDYIGDLARRDQVIFISGNHDWSVDYEAHFPGVVCREALRIGDRILAWHGHQVDLLMNPGARDATPKTYVHALLERLVKQRLIPPLERYDSRANRIAMAVAVNWSRVTLARARGMRRLGNAAAAAALEQRVRYLARSVNGDPADIFGATTRTILGDFDTVVCGHTHVPGIARTDVGVYVNTGTWTCGTRTCALFDGHQFRVIDLDSGREIGDEHYSGVPAETRPVDLFEWWATARRSRSRQ